MKKRTFTLILAICLCLGFVIPASAAKASDLTSGEAASYVHVLNNQPYSFSALEDLNMDGKSELILINIDESTDSMFEMLDLTVWTIQNGAATKTMSQSISAYGGSALNDVGIARQTGATRIYVSESNPPMNSASYSFYDMNGNGKTYQGEMDLAGTAAIDSLYEELEQKWKFEYLFHGEGGFWYSEENKISDVSEDLHDRMEQASNFDHLENETATVGSFLDVKADAYYADAVVWAVDKKITSGTSATTFGPDNTCTTAQILTFLWRANGSPAISGSNPFSDVPDDAYYYQAALWAREKGLISGSVFRGDTPCTRASTVTYLWKLAGRPSVGGGGFTDVPASASYAQAVAWAVNEGITSGTGDEKFSPDAICTRGQIMTFIYRDILG